MYDVLEYVRYAAECEIPAEKPMDAMGIMDYFHMGVSKHLWQIRKHITGKEPFFFDCVPFKTGGKKVERISVKSYEYEPGFAPLGKVVLQVNVPQFDKEYLYWKSLSKEGYARQKKEVARAIEERLMTQFPALSEHIEFLDCWTPITYERYCNAYHGAYMGFITRKDVKSFRVKGKLKGVKNLYIASQWIMAPGGLPVAVTAGKFAVWQIARKDKRMIKDSFS